MINASLVLEDFDVICDCFYTPSVSWLNAEGEELPSGSDYRHVNKDAHMCGNILEVLVTIRQYKLFISEGALKHRLKALTLGRRIWLRPP